MRRTIKPATCGDVTRGKGAPWTLEELEATVAAYLDMLEHEVRGAPLNKTAFRRALLPQLDGRTNSAVELKHQNISAVLLEARLPCIDGYKPMSNYQHALQEVVLRQLAARPTLHDLLTIQVTAPAAVPTVEDILAAWTAPPEGERATYAESRERRVVRYRSPVDYLLAESRNRALGAAGEEFVLRFEQARLIAARKEALASRIRHVARLDGDGAGYDILSYDSDGSERLVEVKTTRYSRYTPFFVSPNELEVSREHATRYHLYRVFSFGAHPALFGVTGALDAGFSLVPSEFSARVR
jgi:hypothetical protein